MSKLKTIFRYPGGKSKIANSIVEEVLSSDTDLFVDVFTGGGSIPVELLNHQPQHRTFVLNDKDEFIHAFWHTLISTDNTNLLIKAIREMGRPTIEKFITLRKIQNPDDITKALMAIFFNRTTFSGIFKSGPIGGYDQSGKYKIDCRYNMEKIINNVFLISQTMSKTIVHCFNYDFRKILMTYGNNSKTFLYLDPPYMKQGRQLYNHYMIDKDYTEMASLLKYTKGKWIVSHDNHPDFVKLFKGWAYMTDTQSMPYTINSIKNHRVTELFISNFEFQKKNLLAWLE
jgi:DNA adenine methylase